MKSQLIASLLLLQSLLLCARSDSTKYTIISLKQAIEEHKVKTHITGSYNTRKYLQPSDGDGLHYGKCMDVFLESEIDTFVILKLDAGYSLIPDDSSYQTMFVTKTIEVPLYPRATVPYNIYAMCGEIHDKAPYSGIKYSLGTMVDTNLLFTIKLIEREYLQNMIGQHLLWSVANQASKDELIKYGADSVSLAKVTSELKDNNISCTLLKEGNTKPKQEELKPAFMKVKRITFYAGISYMIIITAGFIYLATRKYVRRIPV